ncbi:MAG: phage DNA packaging protein J, partial [Microlunatus sp.]|nr:phage DNA packaging protein J [Microlunatus sp.]
HLVGTALTDQLLDCGHRFSLCSVRPGRPLPARARSGSRSSARVWRVWDQPVMSFAPPRIASAHGRRARARAKCRASPNTRNKIIRSAAEGQNSPLVPSSLVCAHRGVPDSDSSLPGRPTPLPHQVRHPAPRAQGAGCSRLRGNGG